MNAPFDPEAVADGALRAVGAAEGQLILSPASPLDSARQLIRRNYWHADGRTIHHHRGVLLAWRGTHYREIESDDIRAHIYTFLEGARQLSGEKLIPFHPNRARVADVQDALTAAAQLDNTTGMPSWLVDGEHPPASEILACANGLLHLPTGTVLPNTPTYFSVNAVDYPYDSAAGTPETLLQFLQSIWPDDRESISTLQELFGLLLTANTAHQKAFLIFGPKRSGKGTIARVITGLLGRDNVAGPTLSSMSQNFGLAPLIGKPLAIIADARLGGKIDGHVITERILAITGEDILTIDRKYREPWTGQLPTRLLMLTNELPKLHDASGALASRFIVLRLTESFYGQEDLSLTGKLLSERPAILCWAIEGWERLAERGHFIQPKSADQALRELADLASPIGAFVRERCVIGPLTALTATISSLPGSSGAWTSTVTTLARFSPSVAIFVPWCLDSM